MKTYITWWSFKKSHQFHQNISISKFTNIAEYMMLNRTDRFHFLAHLAKGHVSYCHHLASSLLTIFLNFCPLTLLDQLELGMNVPWGIIELMWGFLIRRKT